MPEKTIERAARELSCLGLSVSFRENGEKSLQRPHAGPYLRLAVSCKRQRRGAGDMATIHQHGHH